MTIEETKHPHATQMAIDTEHRMDVFALVLVLATILSHTGCHALAKSLCRAWFHQWNDPSYCLRQ
jgi:hypothetical protein